jgi:hypothetical protein
MTVRQTRDIVTSSLTKLSKKVSVLPREAFNFWVSKTPKRTGNARRNTRLRGDTIQADYQYAVPLDKGSSSQSPQGMSKPTEKFISQKMKKNMRK